jgi:hypothetical protein
MLVDPPERIEFPPATPVNALRVTAPVPPVPTVIEYTVVIERDEVPVNRPPAPPPPAISAPPPAPPATTK